MEQIKLGQHANDDAKRDAIHIAICPVVADEKLAPGQDIGFVDYGNPEKVGLSQTPVGIVDPFLKNMVFPGQRFYMLLYPNTITSLRHEWTHPAFQESVVVRKPTKKESEEWIRNFISGADCPDYDTLIAAATGETHPAEDGYYGYRLSAEYLHFGGDDAHGEIPPEIWNHIENVTGKKCVLRPLYFSCSC